MTAIILSRVQNNNKHPPEPVIPATAGIHEPSPLPRHLDSRLRGNDKSFWITRGGPAHRRAAGFTLLELMITLAVLVILTMIAVPSMTNLIRDARLSTQTDLLVNTLNTARIEAIKQRKNMTICAANNPNTATACGGAGLWSNGVIIYDPADVAVVKRLPFPAGVTVDSASSSVVFNATIGSAAAVTFTLCAPERRQQVVNVLPSGRVTKSMGNTTCS